MKEKIHVTIQVYRDGITDDWRWQMTEIKSGKRIGASTEGYRHRRGAFHNLQSVTGFEPELMPMSKQREYRWDAHLSTYRKVWS